MRVQLDDPLAPDVRMLLDEHLADMYATSPPESVHALEPNALTGPDMRFYTVRDGQTLLGCGALKALSTDAGELKSMRTATQARGRGVASLLLKALVEQARVTGWSRLSLETGVEDYFAPARRLYERHGFVTCGPFADYSDDPNSVYYTLELGARAL